MSPALRRITHALVLLWWLPSIVFLFGPPVLWRIGFKLRARRARRLMEAGDMVEADRVVARLRVEAEACRRWVEDRTFRTASDALGSGLNQHQNARTAASATADA